MRFPKCTTSSHWTFAYALLLAGLISTCSLGHNIDYEEASLAAQICTQCPSLGASTAPLAYPPQRTSLLFSCASCIPSEDRRFWILFYSICVIYMSKNYVYSLTSLSKQDKLDESILRIRTFVWKQSSQCLHDSLKKSEEPFAKHSSDVLPY